MLLIRRVGILLVTVVALAAPATGHDYERSHPAGGPFSREAVLNAPFSADATTSVRILLSDGTARVQTVTARYYRDSQGRVRAELDTPWGPYVVVEIPGLPTPKFYTVDLDKRTYRNGAGYYYASQLFNGEGRTALPVAKVCFQTPPPVVDASANERLRAVNAQLSPDLGIVTASYRSDLIATIDYKVTNIRREEPSAELFNVTDYTFVQGSRDDPLVGFAAWQSPSGCRTTS